MAKQLPKYLTMSYHCFLVKFLGPMSEADTELSDEARDTARTPLVPSKDSGSTTMVRMGPKMLIH
mgnify:CR=1 FL=1